MKAFAQRSTRAGRALALLLWGATLAAGAQAAGTPEQARALVEVTAAHAEYFVGQPIHVQVAFGLEQEFLERHAVQPFGAALELPVQLHLDWLGELAGATPVELSPPPSTSPPGASFALNGTLWRARRLPDRVVDGRVFRMHALDARFMATGRGTLQLSAPVLSFAYATRFKSTLLDDRAPLDRVDASVVGAPLALSARALPEAGRPIEFTGAVGSVTLRAEAEQREVVLGESLKLRLVIEGDANLAQFEAPRWNDLGGFRVLGMLDEREPGARVWTLDLVPLSDQVWQVPAVPLSYFDPGPPAGYRVARSGPLDVRVLPRDEGARPGATPPVERERAALPEVRGTAELLLPLLGGVALLLIAALVLRRLRS